MEVFGSCTLGASLRDVFADSIYPLDSPILLVPLNEDEHNCWLKFLEIARPRCHYIYFRSHRICYELEETLLELNHPFLPAVVDFAVDAFNDLCRMYFKKSVKDNINEAEVTNVKYSPNCYGYTFFITLEAMEENVVGVYETSVICDFEDGRRTLLKFVRCPPVGGKFKRMAGLIREKSGYKDVKGGKLTRTVGLIHEKSGYKAVKGGKLKRTVGLIHEKSGYKAVKGGKLKRTAGLIREKSGYKAVKDDWFVPNKLTGLQPRSAEHSCGGYDYRNPLTVFSWHAKK